MNRTTLSVAILAVILGARTAWAGESPSRDDTTARLDAVKKKLAGRKYDLRYKVSAGETIRYKVLHLATIETRIRGVTQTAKSRSASTKAWKVTGVDAQHGFTFVHSVEDIDMWNQISGIQEVRYNSKTDKKPPLGYEDAAASVGVPLTVATVDAYGKLLKRENKRRQFGQGGQLLVPLPPHEVKIGDKWFYPYEVIVKLRSGQIKRIKLHEQYRLESVKTGVATISVETQVLTPLKDPEIESQLVQRLTSGTIKFDIDAGRVLSRQLDQDKVVIGFSGPESFMKCLARLTEELLPADARTARKE